MTSRSLITASSRLTTILCLTLLYLWGTVVPNELIQCSIRNGRMPYSIQCWQLPWLMLASLTQLVTDLNNAANNYFLAWNPTLVHWETHTINTICHVTENEWLVYKLVKQIMAEFPDNQYPGLTKELVTRRCYTNDFVLLVEMAYLHRQPPLLPQQSTREPGNKEAGHWGQASALTADKWSIWSHYTN